jgi:DNA-binding MarR family transcriptional regulator
VNGKPLPALLSQLLVAFTIELDTEFEHQMPHRTTRGPADTARDGPWLVSMAMWSNFMAFIDVRGVALAQVEDLARLTNLPGLQRWGYVTVGPGPADTRGKPPRRDWVVRPTRAGARAQQVWQPLAGVIEARWQDRFGTRALAELRESLSSLADQLDVGPPHYLPVAGVSKREPTPWPVGATTRDLGRQDLSVLLSRVLLALSIDFERASRLSLAVSADALRVVEADGVRVWDLPRLAGISREATAISVRLLEKQGCLVIEPDLAARGSKQARLTPKGEKAQEQYRQALSAVDQVWRTRFGAHVVDRLDESARAVIAQRDRDDQPGLSRGLVPYPQGWRAHSPYREQTKALVGDPAAALAHYPMVSHRGGFPDGS